MQTLADQILLDTDRQKGELEVASATASEMLDWLRGCVVDSQGVVDAASRVESISRRLLYASNGRDVVAAESENPQLSDDESHAESLDEVTAIADRYRRLRATVDGGENLRDAIRHAVDGARRIRTGAEALHGHAQTLQILALDLHAQGGAGRTQGPNGGYDSDAEKMSGTAQPRSPRA
jgi:hypothetical protein